MSSKSQSFSSSLSSSSSSASSFTYKHRSVYNDYIDESNINYNELKVNTKRRFQQHEDLVRDCTKAHCTAILNSLNLLRETRILCDVNLIAEGKVIFINFNERM
jgi:hypothetical protein